MKTTRNIAKRKILSTLTPVSPTASQTGPGLQDPDIQQDDAVTADHYQQQPPLPDNIHDSDSGMHAHSKLTF